MLWDEPKIFFLERRYFFSIILSEFLKNRVALQSQKDRLPLCLRKKLRPVCHVNGSVHLDTIALRPCLSAGMPNIYTYQTEVFPFLNSSYCKANCPFRQAKIVNLRQKIRFFASQSKSAATWLSPYTGMPFFLSSSAVTPSPTVRVPEKLPS